MENLNLFFVILFANIASELTMIAIRRHLHVDWSFIDFTKKKRRRKR